MRERTWERALERLGDGYRSLARRRALPSEVARARRSDRPRAAQDRRRAARHRAGDVRALRPDPRLAGRPRRRPRDVARDPGPRPAPARRALAGDDRAGWPNGGCAGDSIAQHGFQHERARRSGLSPQALLSSPARRARRVRRARRRRDAASGQRRLARAEARRSRARRIRRAGLRLHARAAQRASAQVPLVGGTARASTAASPTRSRPAA